MRKLAAIEILGKASWLHLAPALCLFGVVLWLATRVGVAALREGAGAQALPAPLALLDHRLPILFRIHMIAGGLALILLPWTIMFRPFRRTHRLIGQITAALVFMTAVAAIPSALSSVASPVARAGFLTQAILCLLLLAAAVVAARRHQWPRHRRLMTLVAALIGGAVVLRIMLMAATAWRLPFAPAYAAIAWLSWGLPVALIYVWPRLRQLAGPPRHTAAPVRISRASNG